MEGFQITFSVVNPSVLVVYILFYVATNFSIGGLLSLLFHNEIYFRQWMLYMELWVPFGLGPLIALDPKPCHF
jgi:hypothetical protein